MSAFVVTNRAVNQVVTHLIDDRDRQGWVQHQLEQHGLPNGQDHEALGRAMMALNVEAVNQRYSEGPRDTDQAYEFRYELCSAEQALKSLRCWIYQCSEGDVPERPLYHVMERYGGELALGIVAATPAYAAADWDPPESTGAPIIRLSDLVRRQG